MTIKFGVLIAGVLGSIFAITSAVTRPSLVFRPVRCGPPQIGPKGVFNGSRMDESSHLFISGCERRRLKVPQLGFEGGAPAALSRRGFKRNDIKVGDTLVVGCKRPKEVASGRCTTGHARGLSYCLRAPQTGHGGTPINFENPYRC